MANATGQSKKLGATFKVDGTATNATVVLKILSPQGTLSTPTPTALGDGVYSYELLLEEEGFYYYKWEASGAVIAATDDQMIYVEPSKLG